MTWPTDEVREAVVAYLEEHSFDDAQCAACGTVRWEHAEHFLAFLTPHVAALVREVETARDVAERKVWEQQEHIAYHLRDYRPNGDMRLTGDLAVDMAAYAERMKAERDALAARLAKVEALAERWHEVGLVCECGHGLDQHNGLGCYARLSYAPLVTCECLETDDRHEEEFAVRDLRDALTEERADG